MRVLIFGGNGFMANHLKQVFPAAVTPKTDIGDPAQVAEALDIEKPDIVINAAGKTGRPNVDWCEVHKAETLHSNVLGPIVLLEETSKRNIYFVHLSSGCIYEGDKKGEGFTEDDLPNFTGSFYSRTKGWSDQILKDFPVLQLRVRMPFDGSGEPRNLISKLKNYTNVLDAENSLTYIPDFLDATQKLIDKRAVGTFNIVNPKTASPWRIMLKYKEIVDPAHAFEKLELKNLNGIVKAGRSNCLLSTRKLEGQGITLPPVDERLEEALKHMKEQSVLLGIR